MKKGIVMEVKPNTIVMMTPEGEFIKTKKQPTVQYEIGEELTFFPQTSDGNTPGLFHKWKEKLRIKPVITGAAAMLMLFLFIFSPIFKEPEVFAYVSVDINPSFELSIDQDKEVVDIKAFNKEARKMLQQMADPEGKSIVAVTDEIIDLSSKEGYMDDEKKVTVTTVFTREAKTRDKSSIEEAIKRFSTEKLKEDTVAISLIDSSYEVREEAAAAGMTAGQLIKQKEESKEIKEKAPASPSKTKNSKADDRKDLPREIPSKEDKKTSHAKEKQAEKGKSEANPGTKGTKSHNGASEIKKEDSNKNNGSGKGHTPHASENKASPPSHTQEKRGNGSPHKQKEQQKSNGSSSSRPKQKEEQRGKEKENRNERKNDRNEHHGPKNDKEKGNRN
ncbi:anti-sigma factor domain-containing protein [Rossellomorea vietnamensis]|uniref:Anti-sigma factor domain-containing protein n=1 Tax=Rossellomorea vietnamensis TaxID=218284 RepID=A0A5D4NQ39_9BACI|nr:anti-sigma factor domain-containing protein [Rossellomorea vietnamensis]TYS15774.1 anti-sigma factor domain-containing protein [Rossellomorea vietnamensis]